MTPAVAQREVPPWAYLYLAAVVGVLPVLLAAGFRRGRWPALVPTALVALLAAVSLLRVQVPVPGMRRALSGSLAVPLDQVGAALVLVVLPVGIGLALRLADQRRRTAELTRIRAAERLQVARELHDLVAGHVTGITMFARGADVDGDPERLRGLLGSIETSGRDALAAMHRMVGALRAEELPGELVGLPTSATDVTGAVHSAVGEGHRATMRIDPPAAGAAVPAHLLTTLHRVVTESLTNVRRHAPSADEIAVGVSMPGGGVLVVEVLNDGVGRPGAARRTGGGYGLVGLTERVATLGGTLRAGPDGPGRWRVRAELPVADPARGGSARTG